MSRVLFIAGVCKAVEVMSAIDKLVIEVKLVSCSVPHEKIIDFSLGVKRDPNQWSSKSN